MIVLWLMKKQSEVIRLQTEVTEVTKQRAVPIFVKLLLEQVSIIKKTNEALTKSSKNEGTGKSSGCAKKNQLN
jgi:hypothetical protein